AIAFKRPLPPHDGLAFTALTNNPEPDRVAMVADRIAALVRLQAMKRADRRIAVLMPDYPGAPGRTGYAVGLDVPESVMGLLSDLKAAGYRVGGAPEPARALLDAVGSLSSHPSAENEEYCLSLEDYARLSEALPPEVSARMQTAWGDPTADPDVRDGAFRF